MSAMSSISTTSTMSAIFSMLRRSRDSVDSIFRSWTNANKERLANLYIGGLDSILSNDSTTIPSVIDATPEEDNISVLSGPNVKETGEKMKEEKQAGNNDRVLRMQNKMIWDMLLLSTPVLQIEAKIQKMNHALNSGNLILWEKIKHELESLDVESLRTQMLAAAVAEQYMLAHMLKEQIAVLVIEKQKWNRDKCNGADVHATSEPQAMDKDEEDRIQAQRDVLNDLGLCAFDAGSQNINENGERIQNSCFYLSLAVSYLIGVGLLVMGDDGNNLHWILEIALQLKRIIEVAVVAAHPEWLRMGEVGENVQACADFLSYLLGSEDTLLSDWAVVVFDSTYGSAQIFKGKYYDDHPKWLQSNTLTIQHLPGHFQPLLPTNDEKRPCLSEILETLDKHGVLYAITDGAA